MVREISRHPWNVLPPPWSAHYYCWHVFSGCGAFGHDWWPFLQTETGRQWASALEQTVKTAQGTGIKLQQSAATTTGLLFAALQAHRHWHCRCPHCCAFSAEP